MCGDMPVVVHRLVPQLENALRRLLERASGRTTSLDSEGLQQDRTLGLVLCTGELEEALGPNALFDLKCLLIERFGANLRNLLSHGLVDHASISSSLASYLCWLVLHLCAVPVLLRAREDEKTEGKGRNLCSRRLATLRLGTIDPR